MLAAVLHDFNNLLLEDIPIPDPGPGEVLIQIQSCGFCATDFKAILGIRRNVDFPLVPGHEPAGIVAGIGSHVTHVKEGGHRTDVPEVFITETVFPVFLSALSKIYRDS